MGLLFVGAVQAYAGFAFGHRVSLCRSYLRTAKIQSLFRARSPQREEATMLLTLINILIIIVIGAILFWVIEKYVRDGRLANLLKLLVVLLCIAAILQRILPLFGVGWF